MTAMKRIWERTRGWRTIILNSIIALFFVIAEVLVYAAGLDWRELLPPEYASWVVVGINVLNIFMRHITKTQSPTVGLLSRTMKKGKANKPPFDGIPCPACPEDVRALYVLASRLLDNTVRRSEMDRVAALRRLHEFERYASRYLPAALASEAPQIRAFAEATRDVLRLAEAGKPLSAILPALGLLADLEKAVAPIIEKHFANRSHSLGDTQ